MSRGLGSRADTGAGGNKRRRVGGLQSVCMSVCVCVLYVRRECVGMATGLGTCGHLWAVVGVGLGLRLGRVGVGGGSRGNRHRRGQARGGLPPAGQANGRGWISGISGVWFLARDCDGQRGGACKNSQKEAGRADNECSQARAAACPDATVQKKGVGGVGIA